LLAQKPPRGERHVSVGHDAFELAPRLSSSGDAPGKPQLIPLLRTLEQVEVALELGFPELELDFMELVGLGVAVAKVRAAGRRVVIATPRVQKPGEEGYARRFERLRPDGILARHLGAVEHFRQAAAGGTPGPDTRWGSH